MNGAAKLSMPLSPPMWGVVSLKISRSEMRALLGAPHFVETDPRCTCGGEEDAWAFVLPSAHRIIIIADSGGAYVGSDPPDAEPALEFLKIARTDSRVMIHEEPFTLC
jgi:hypothetical protein